MSSYSTIQQGNETDLQAAVGLSGPVAVTIDHSQRSFQVFMHAFANVIEIPISVYHSSSFTVEESTVRVNVPIVHTMPPMKCLW